MDHYNADVSRVMGVGLVSAQSTKRRETQGGGVAEEHVCGNKMSRSEVSVIHNTPFGLEDRSGGSRTSGASACSPCVLSCRAGCRKIHSTAPLHPSGFFIPRATELSVLGPSLRSASESFKSVTFSWFSIHSPPLLFPSLWFFSLTPPPPPSYCILFALSLSPYLYSSSLFLQSNR